MTEHELRSLLRGARVPDEDEAERRGWEVVRAAFEAREVEPRRRWRVRPLLAAAALAAVAAVALTPPGAAVGAWIRETLEREPAAGRKDARPALASLPAPGRILVTSARGAWIVAPDGSRRLVGAYEDASWSPTGQFVVATRGHQLVAVEPRGKVRWSLSRGARVETPRWLPGTGYRIAYRVRRSLRVVAGDGTGDRLLARPVAPAPPAWRPPGTGHVIAYATAAGVVRVAAADSGRLLWESRRGDVPALLAWSADGRRLAALAPRSLRLFDGRGRLLARIRLGPGRRAVTAAFAPRGHRLALVRRLASGRSEVVLVRAERRARGGRRLFAGAGRFSDVAWSPDGRWLLVSWPTADQWFFLRMPRVDRVLAVSRIAREFDPGGRGAARFPRVVGWCCAGS